jgi:glycosyltransferase involved in cell wall biosynthesis
MHCETLLLSSKEVDKSLIERNFAIKAAIDDKVILPVEFPRLPYFMTLYWKYLIPSFIRNECNLILDASSNLLLPFVDVNYFHGFKQIGGITKEHQLTPQFLHPSQMINLLLQRTQSFRSKKLAFANTNFTALGIQKLIGIKPLVVYPPVNTSVFNAISKTSKKDIVLTISRFSTEKNLEIIPKIAYKMNAKFVIIGSVYDQLTLAEYRRIIELVRQYNVTDKVHVYANLSFSDKLFILGRSKVYLHTMKFEDFGISIVEGMSASCIPVVHNSGGPVEFVPKKWLYDDVESARQRVDEALVEWSPEVGNQMSDNAAQFDESKFRDSFSSHFKEYVASL